MSSGRGERFFRSEPSEVSKDLRMRFIDIKTDGGSVKGKIAFYCAVLNVTSQGFYWYLTHRDTLILTISSGGVYCAWISTYVAEIGWINGVIRFDGVNWTLMDPTFAASSYGANAQYPGEGVNYQALYRY